jgi:hypothetical protein
VSVLSDGFHVSSCKNVSLISRHREDLYASAEQRVLRWERVKISEHCAGRNTVVVSNSVYFQQMLRYVERLTD